MTLTVKHNTLTTDLVGGAKITDTEWDESHAITGSLASTDLSDGDTLVLGPVSATDSHVVMFDGTTGKLIKDSGLTLAGSNTGDQTNVTGNAGTATTLATSRSIGMSGDVTWTVNFDGSGNVTAAGTIANSAVTLTKMADMATASFMGRNTAGSGAPEILSAATSRSILGLGTGYALNVDTDTTLAANSDANVATQKAIKAYVDNAVVGLLDYKGSTDCSTNPNYPAALKGDTYMVSVAGKIGGASGDVVEVGDMFTALADNAGGTKASVGSSWDITQHNLNGAMLAANNLSDLTSTATARTNLGVAIGTNVQAYSSVLATYAGISPSANVQTLLGAANYAAFKSSLSLDNVENTALSTWAGSSSITTIGNVTSGTVNKVTVTAPATAATFTLANNSSLITAGAFALTLTATATTNATFPAGTVTLAQLGAQTFTGAQTFPASGVILTGSSTGKTTFTSANASGTNYTLTFPAVTSTVLTQSSPAITTPTITGTIETKAALGASNIDCATGNAFTKTISGTTTLTVSNVPSSGSLFCLLLDLTNGGSHTVNWWSGVKWPGGIAPTLTVSGRDSLGFFTYDGGTTWNGFVLGKAMA